MRVSLVLALLFVFPLAGCKKERDADPRRHSESRGGFSFVPPDGWQVKDFPGLKFKIALGPATADFAPNINVVDEVFGGTVDDYVRANIATLQKAMPSFRQLKKDPFTTDSGVQGIRLVSENQQQGRQLRQTQYFFGKGSTKYVVTCTATAQSGAQLEPLFETCLKSFRFD